MKILVAYGETEEGHWNWCNPGEMVSVHGLLCHTDDKRLVCGCGISFTGCVSSKGTTRAVVRDVPDKWFEHLASEFAEAQEKAWPGAELEDKRKLAMDWLLGIPECLERFEDGQVLCIDKMPGGFNLIPQVA